MFQVHCHVRFRVHTCKTECAMFYVQLSMISWFSLNCSVQNLLIVLIDLMSLWNFTRTSFSCIVRRFEHTSNVYSLIWICFLSSSGIDFYSTRFLGCERDTEMETNRLMCTKGYRRWSGCDLHNGRHNRLTGLFTLCKRYSSVCSLKHFLKLLNHVDKT